MTQPAATKGSKKHSSISWIYFAFGILLLFLVGWTTFQAIRDTPMMVASVELPGQGWISVEFRTYPNPPLATGMVMLTFMPSDHDNQMVNLGGSLPFTYGIRGNKQPVGSGQAVLNAEGMGYQASVNLPEAGDYWLVLEVGSGKQARYQFFVRREQ